MEKFRNMICSLLLAVITLSGASVNAQTTWQPRAPFPLPPPELLAVTANGKLHVFGGLKPKFVPRGVVYEYDPASDVWTAKKPMPLASHHLALAEYKGKIYAFGGFKYPATGEMAWEPIDNSWEYDPATDTWKALKAMPSKRGAAGAAVVSGKVYVVGGAGDHPGSKLLALTPGSEGSPHRSLSTVEAYDIASDTWRECSTMPTPRNHFVVATVNGKIYAIGGRLSSAFLQMGSATDVVEEYDPTTDSWGVTRARTPYTHDSMASGVYGGKIYIVGGEMQNSQMMTLYRTVEAYDPSTNQWLSLPPVPVGRKPITGDVIGGILYVISGDNGDRPLIGLRTESEPFPFDALNLEKLK